MHKEIERVFSLQQKKRSSLASTSAKERIEKMMLIDRYLRNGEREAELYEAMYKDLRKPEVEVFATEIGVVQAQISYIRKHLQQWMLQKKVRTPLPLLGTRSYIHYEPRGVVLIISPWNYPLNLSLVPLVYAIAAGNAVILKPSEISPHTSAFIKKMIEGLFDKSEVAVFEGDATVAQSLLQLPFNHIFFTGSPGVGKIVMSAAAKHLTTVTLELGAKSPTIIDETADVKKTARSLAWAKSVNCGQTCISPDHVIVHESKHKTFIKEYIDAVKDFYDPEGKGIRQSPDYCRIVSDAHFIRLKGLYDDATDKGADVIFGGDFESADRFISPTLLNQINYDMDIMQEEIFGPLLPVMTYKDREQAVEMVSHSKGPLTLYIASRNQDNIDHFIKNSTAGGTVINDHMLGYSNPALPFGGVGNSGMGRSLGMHGFIAFSNERGVIHRRWGSMDMIYPPYDERIKKIIKALYRWM